MEISALEEAQAVINCSSACDSNETVVVKPTSISSAKVIPAKVNSSNTFLKKEGKVINTLCKKLYEKNHSVKNSLLEIKKQRPKKKLPKKLTSTIQNKLNELNNGLNCINKAESKQKIGNSVAFVIPQIFKPSRATEDFQKETGQSRTPKDSTSDSIVIEQIIQRSKPWGVIDSIRPGTSKDYSQPILPKEPSSLHKGHSQLLESKHSSKPNIEKEHPKHGSSKDSIKLDVSKDFPVPSSNRAVDKCLSAHESSVPSMSRRKYLYLFRSRSHHVVVKKHGIKVYRCDICCGEYRQNFSLKRHFLRSHVNAKYVSKSDILNCKIREGLLTLNSRKEEASSRKKSKVENEIFLENNDNRAMPNLFKCHICSNVTFDLEKEIRAHYKKQHSEGQKKKFHCDMCDAIFGRKQFLIKHRATHRPPAFECRECDIHFSSKSEYKKHALSHSNHKSVCRTCLKTFSSTANRKRHEKLHQGPIRTRGRGKKPESSNKQSPSKPPTVPVVQPLKVKICPVCKKAFSTYLAMMKHRSKKHPILSRRRRTQRPHVPKVLKKKDLAALARKSEYDFYCNVSQRIADNLLHHLDGKAKTLSLKKYNFSDHVEPTNYNNENLVCLPWSSYNFPNGFDVDYAVRNRGQEIKQKPPENLSVRERSLYATGLNKVNLSPASSSNCNDSIWSESSNDASEAECNSESSFRNDIKGLSLEGKKKLIGKELVVVCLCTICKESFTSYDDYDKHCENNHPNIECSCIEIEGDTRTPPQVPVDLCRQYVNSDGVFFSCSVPPPLSQAHLLKCTKCKTEFSSSVELHKHILDCGGNECAVAKYVRTQRKRIKRTMKNRIDLSAKLSPTKRLNHFYKNGRLQTTSMKCDKNYFSTKPVKQMKSTLNLKQKPPLKQKVECPTCKRVFRSEVNMKSHVVLCFKRTLSNKKAESNNHKGRTKLADSSFPKEHSLVKHDIPNEIRAAANKNAESQKRTENNSSNVQSIPALNASGSKAISDVDTSGVSKNSSPLATNANSSISNGTGTEETAVDLTVKSQVHAQKSSSTNTLSTPKPQSALDKAMEAATEFAKSMPKMKKMSPISSLSETVKRLTKQLSGRTTGLETFNLNINPPKKSPRKQIGPSGLKTAAPESTKNDPKCVKKIEHREKENTPCKSDSTSAKMRTENASTVAKKPIPDLAKSPSHNLNNSDKPLMRSEDLITPEKKIPKFKIKISSGVEDQKTVSAEEVANDSDKISSPVKTHPPKLQFTATEDVAVVSSPDHLLKKNAAIGNTELKMKDSPINTPEKASTDATLNAEFKSVGSLNETTSSNANNKSDASFSSIDLSDTQSDNGSTDKFPTLSNSVLFLPDKKETKTRRSSGSQGRISPSLESIVNSIKQKLHSQELDPPQQCVSWLEDEKFDIPSSSPKLILPVNINSTSDPLSISKKLDFQPIEVNHDSSDASKSLGSDSTFLRDKVEVESSSVMKSVMLNEKPAPTELLSISSGGNEFSDALSKSKRPSIDDNVEEIKSRSIETSEPLKKSVKVASAKKSKVQELTSTQTSIPSVKTSKKMSKKMSNTDCGMELVKPNSVCRSAVPKQNISSDITLAKPWPKSSFNAKEKSPQINSTLSNVITSVPVSELKRTSIDSDLIAQKEALDSDKVVSCEKEETVTKSCKSSLDEKNLLKTDGNSRSDESMLKDKEQTISNRNASLSTKLFNSSKVDNHSEKKDTNSSISVDDVAKMEKSGLTSIKKKGRPRKNVSHLQVAPKPKIETETVVVKRKPGRPFKRKRGRRGWKRALDESLSSSVIEIINKSEDELASSSAHVINQSEEKYEKDDADKNISSNVNSAKKTNASPEVRTTFGRNLASKMKEKMRQSFKSAPTEKPTSTDLSSNSVNDTIVESATNNDITTLIQDLSAEADSISHKEPPLDSEADVLVKMEQEFKEDAKKHFCPFCLGEFAYLTNYRRHLKICKERLNSHGLDYDSVPQCSSGLLQFLPKKDEVESSMLDLARHQSRQSQILKETETNVNNKKGFRTYSCRFCHRIYLSLFQFLQHQMNSHKIIKGEVDMESRSDQSEYQAFGIKAEDAMSAEVRAMICEDSRYLSEERCDSETSNIESVTNSNDLENTQLVNIGNVNSENEQEFADEPEDRNEQLQAEQSVIRVMEENEMTLKSADVPENEDHTSIEAVASKETETLGSDQTDFISLQIEETTATTSSPLASASLDMKAKTDSVPSLKDTKNISISEFDHFKPSNTTAEVCVSVKGIPSKRGRRRRFKGQVHNFIRRKASAANLSKKLTHAILNEKASLLANSQEEKAVVMKGSKHPLLNPNKKNIFHKIKRKFIRKKAKNVSQELINASEKVDADDMKTETDLKAEKLSVVEDSTAVVKEKKEDEHLGKILNNRTSGIINKKVRKIKKEKKIMKFGMKRTLASVKLNSESKLIKPRGRPRKEPISISEPSIPAASAQKIPSSLQKEMTPKRRYMKKSVMFSPPSTSKNHGASTSFNSKTRNAKGLQSFPTIDDSSNDDDVAPPEATTGPPQKKKRAKICPVCKKKFPATLLRNRHIQLIHSRKTPIDIASISPENLKKKRNFIETVNRSTLKRVCRKPSPEKRPKKTELN